MDYLTAIRQRAIRATPGPWETNVMYTGNYAGGPAHVAAVAAGKVETAILKEGRKSVYVYRSDWPENTSIVVKDTGEMVAHSTDEYGAISQEDAAFIAHARDDIPDLLYRIEALERALVTARTALTVVEWLPSVVPGVGWYCVWGCGGVREKGHVLGCKRQQALTEIAGAMGAEPCKHEQWVTEVEWSDPKYQGDYWKPAKRRITGSVTKQDVFCASCGIAADKVTP